MRKLTPPPFSAYCQKCGGELRLKKIEATNEDIDIDIEVFICAGCGNEQSLMLNHDPRTPHTGSPR
jgi:hypothetical protein